MERKVKDLNLSKSITIEELSRQYLEAGGFVAKNVGVGVEIIKEMMEKSKMNFLSFPACVVSTGLRGLLKELVKRKKFQIVVTSCGTLDHDFARIWKDYYHGSFDADDRMLRKEHKHRLGNIFIPNENYGGIIEEKLQPMLKDMYNSGIRRIATYEFVWEVGKRLEKEKKKEESIIYWCYKNKIPMIIPGITDGAFGLQITMFLQDHKDFIIDSFKDELFLLEKMFDKKPSGALMIGGGISKHHVIWWNQFRGGLDYAVYITTAPEWDGSLSGARVREGISWGKVKENAKFVTIDGDATVLLPLVLGPIL